VFFEPVGVGQSGRVVVGALEDRLQEGVVRHGGCSSSVFDLVGRELDRHTPPEQFDRNQTISPVVRYVGDEPVSYERRACNVRR
jgi:hypothetical protein